MISDRAVSLQGMFRLFRLRAVETKAHLICFSLKRSWLLQRGGRKGDIIDHINGFHYTSAKSMTLFFLIYNSKDLFYPPPSIFFLCIIPCAHTVQDYLPVFYRVLLFNIYHESLLYHPTHCLRRLLCLVLLCFSLKKLNFSFSNSFIYITYDKS